MVADAWEKIRVNPGNYADGFKKFDEKVYNSREEYDEDISGIKEVFLPLVRKCMEKDRAMRIGTNHGSLSSRVMSYWGDTPRGMVESAVEYAKICRDEGFNNFIQHEGLKPRGNGAGLQAPLCGNVQTWLTT